MAITVGPVAHNLNSVRFASKVSPYEGKNPLISILLVGSPAGADLKFGGLFSKKAPVTAADRVGLTFQNNEAGCSTNFLA